MFFQIAGVTLVLLNFRTGFSSGLHFQKFLLHHGKLLFLQVCTKNVKEFFLGVFCLILSFFRLCRIRAEEGLRTGGMPPAVFSELSGSAAGDKRERQEGRVLVWVEGVCCH